MEDLERRLTPGDYGPALWGGLHTLGQDLIFARGSWLGFVEFMRNFLNPEFSPGTGCVECWAHFEEWCVMNPPEEVRCAEEACRWGWAAHNKVRARNGKSVMSYQEACARWSW